MEFLVVLIDVVIAALITWWVWHGWYSKDRLSGRLEYAAFKTGCGVVGAFGIPAGAVGKEPGPVVYDLVIIGTYAFIGVTGVLFLAAFVAKVVEAARDREEMRLSGRPVPPRLRAAWKVALISAGVAFLLFMGYMIGTAFLVILTAKADPAVAERGYAELSSWTIGGAFGFWVIVITSYLTQKFRIWKADREYTQLSAGIEHRLAVQRAEILAAINTTKE